MTTETSWHPDLLRRFVATPFVFCCSGEANRSYIQSNDLEIALSVRRSCIARQLYDSSDVMAWKLIRDLSSPDKDGRVSTITDGPLRTLHFGTRTILIHDREKREVLGFVSAQVKVEQLISYLLPALLGRKGTRFYK